MPFEIFVHARTLTLPLPLAPPPPPQKKKKKKKNVFFCQIRIPCQFIEQYPLPHHPPPPPQKKNWILCQKKNHLPLAPPPSPLAHTTHTSPHSPPIFFSDLDYLPT